jgi:16S rRNA (uracil1498-N3)-methyltransferase
LYLYFAEAGPDPLLQNIPLHDMNLFYGMPAGDGTATLTEEESGHCIRVLRKKSGDKIFFTDGEGNYYQGSIVIADPKKCKIAIEETTEHFGKRNYSLHIAIAPTKNLDRFEWFLEKATEIGIDVITPVISSHSERRVLKTERLQKVLLSAMKQSLKAYLPKINEAIPLEKFYMQEFIGQKFICIGSAQESIKRILERESSYTILVGPEGDFTEAEISTAIQNNFKPVNLGPSRLRSETAGVVTCSIVSLLNE